VWRYSVQGEVFALNNLLTASLLLLATLYIQSKEAQYSMLGAMTIGLGLCNQHTVLLFAFPLVGFVLHVGWSTGMGSLGGMSRLVGAGLLGLIPPYAWLAVAGMAPVKHCWGDVGTISGFLTHLLRMEYGTFQLADSGIGQEGLFIERTIYYFVHSAHESSYLALPLMGVGLYASISPAGSTKSGFEGLAYERVGRAFVITWAFYLLAFNYLANLPLDPLHLGVTVRFWMQPHSIACLLAGIGLTQIVPLEACEGGEPAGSTLGPNAGNAGSSMRRAAIVVGLVVIQVCLHGPGQNHSTTTIFEDYGKHCLDIIPIGGLFFTKGDNLVNTIAYLQESEGYRKDVAAVSLGHMGSKWFMKAQSPFFPAISFPNAKGRLYSDTSKERDAWDMKAMLDLNWDRFTTPNGGGPGIFIFGFHPGEEIGMDNDMSASSRDYLRMPHGLVSRIVKPSFRFDVHTWEAENFARLPRYPDIDLSVYGLDSWERGLRRDSILSNFTHAHFYLEQLRGLKGRRDMRTELARIVSMLQQVIDKFPLAGPVRSESVSLDIWRVMGQAYAKLHTFDKSVTEQALRFLRQYVVVEYRPEHKQFVEEAKAAIRQLSGAQ